MTFPVSSKHDGSRFDEAELRAIWEKGDILPGKDPRQYRQDGCGAIIVWSQYGMSSRLGWEVDHIQPRSKGGSDLLENLQPLQWCNNRRKGDSFPSWECALPRARSMIGVCVTG